MAFPSDHLRQFCAALFEAQGVATKSSELVASSLVAAELWGHPSHGLLRAPWYLARLRSGATRAEARPEIAVDAAALALMDGRDGLGQVVAAAAIDSAVARAKQHGIGAVSVRNSGHFGTAMFFTRRAAAAGCIGMLTTNASPAMAPWGGREKRIGNNPWSIAAPTREGTPMVLDISNTVVARGKIFSAIKKGEAIPEGWAMDAAGRPTTDPRAAVEGLILPMAGHKGYAISTMMDVLSGLLSGSAFASGVTGPYVPEGRSGVGHLAIAIDIARLRPLDDFLDDMERLIAEIRAVPRAEGVENVYYPGELEGLAEARNRKSGITLPEDTIKALNAEAEALRVARLTPPVL